MTSEDGQFDQLVARASAIRKEKGDNAAVLECFDQALKLKPDNVDVLTRSAALCLVIDRHEDAFERSRRLLELDPTNKQGWGLLVTAVGKLKPNGDSIEMCDTYLTTKPYSVGTWYTKGIILGLMKRRPEALRCFEEVTALQPGHPEAWFLKGALLCDMPELNRTFEGLRDLDRARQMGLSDAEAKFKQVMRTLGREQLDEYHKVLEGQQKIHEKRQPGTPQSRQSIRRNSMLGIVLVIIGLITAFAGTMGGRFLVPIGLVLLAVGLWLLTKAGRRLT